MAYSKGVQKSLGRTTIGFYLHLLFLFPSGLSSSLLSLDNSSSSFKFSKSVSFPEKPFYDSVGEECSCSFSFHNIPSSPFSDHSTPNLLLPYNSCLTDLCSPVPGLKSCFLFFNGISEDQCPISVVLLVSQERHIHLNPSSQASLQFILPLTRKFSIKQNWEEMESGNLTLIGPLMSPNPNVYLILFLTLSSLYSTALSVPSLITLPVSHHIVL